MVNLTIVNTSYNFLEFIYFKDIESSWSAYSLLTKQISFKHKYSLVKLSSFLTPYKKKISKQEVQDNGLSIISKINFSGDLFLRNQSEVKTYKGNLFRISPGLIIFSKINARHGCIYFHNKDFDFAVSSEYPALQFDNTKINGQFLFLVLRTYYVKNVLKSQATGHSKARVNTENILNLEIPLPSLEVQNKIVNNHFNLLADAENKTIKATELENNIEKYLLSELGYIEYNIHPQKLKTGIYFIRSKDIERWDVWNISIDNKSKKYQNSILDDIVIGKPQYGANIRAKKSFSDTRYIRITDINENGNLNNEFVSAETVEEKYLLKENDFLIARSGNTVGKTFLYKNELGRAIYAGYLVRYKLNLEKVNPDYLLLYTKCKPYKQWIASNQRVSGQPNINGQEFLFSPIIIPPIEVQERIVKHITEIKSEIKKLKLEAEENKIRAKEQVIQELFT